MKIKIDQPVLDFGGKAIVVSDADKTEFTFRMAIETAINFQSNENTLTSEKKLKAFQIGVRLNQKKLAEYDLTVDQIAFIKERIGIIYSPVIYGRFLELIGDEAVKLTTEDA